MITVIARHIANGKTTDALKEAITHIRISGGNAVVFSEDTVTSLADKVRKMSGNENFIAKNRIRFNCEKIDPKLFNDALDMGVIAPVAENTFNVVVWDMPGSLNLEICRKLELLGYTVIMTAQLTRTSGDRIELAKLNEIFK